MMDRRAFISTVTLGLVGASFAASAQQAGRLPTIGFLGASTPSAMHDWVAAFVGRLHELGWIEGRTITIEYRWAEGRTERYAEISNEFVRLKVDVIVTYGTAAIAAAKRATSIIPIVFAGAGDPVGAGLVASLARPGGNITGLSIQQTDAAPKRLDLLREFVPRLGRLAIVANVDSRSAVLDMIEIRDAASALGLHASTVEIRGGEQIVPAIEALRGKADALYVVTDPLLFTNRTRINALATEMRLPTMCSYREYVAAGCFMSYGPNLNDLFRRTAEHVSKILRGAKPADIPVEQPTKFELVINLKTAKALGLTIPQTLLQRADQVIE
jgi:putative tryptophan/tyrosine transport system substrate-binding protein